MTAAATFTSSLNRLLAQVAHWQQPRWSSAISTSPAAKQPSHDIPADMPDLAADVPTGTVKTRADVTFALVQRLADLGADAENRPHRPVPREQDLTLPDQLRVMAADLLTMPAADSHLLKAATAVDATRHAFP